MKTGMAKFRGERIGSGISRIPGHTVFPVFDCGLLSWHSEQALLTARRDPILSRDGGHQRPRYPNVYDSYAEARKMAAFVGGSRVSSLSQVFSLVQINSEIYRLSWY